MIGTKFAHYAITSHLGTGGMGEVYQATDSKLGRSVAIKLLPEAFARNADRLARFEREARVLASLNHPHIAAIYGLEESGGRKFLVMELAAGETLAARISRGPIPLDEALKIAVQIAEALEAAHEKGVMHRDLKPANIKVTADGHVKVLDFGLAKAFEGEAGKANLSNSPTLSMEATNAGVILGTAAYMSPEQAKGRPVDKRTDIFAFGVVLYEMLTGDRLHKGESASEVFAAVLKETPDLNRVPARVRPLLRSCLQKDPKQRLHDIADAKLLLEVSGGEAEAPPRAKASPAWVWPAVAAILLLTAAAVIYSWAPWRSAGGPAPRGGFEVGPAEGMTFANGAAMAVSPNGRWMVFPANGADGVNRLWLQSLDSPELRPLLGTENIGAVAAPASWSFDSLEVVFASRTTGGLKKINILGGSPQMIAAEWPGGLNGASENSAGVIIGGSSLPGTPILKVSASGGQPVPITMLVPKESNHLWPQFLPDEKHFLYLRVSTDANKTGVYIGDIDAKPEEQKMELLLASDRQAYYAALPKSNTGHLIFMRQGALMAQPFDPKTRKLSGEQVAIPGADRVDSYASRYNGIFSVSNTGTLAYRGGSGQQNRLTWYDSHGNPGDTLGEPGDYANPAISPGGLVAVAKGPEPSRDIFILDVKRGFSTTFTFDPARDDFPTWADGKNIVFSSNRSGQMDLWVGSADSPGQARPLLPTNEPNFEKHWTNGFLLFRSVGIKTGDDIWALPFPHGGEPKPVVNEQANERFPRLSSDGRWLAYSSNELGFLEIYVRRFEPEAGANSVRLKVSKGGGRWPVWRPDSMALYYVSPQSQMMTVDIDTSKGFPQLAGEPRPLFPVPSLTTDFGWDLSPDGKFLFIVPPGGARTIPFTVRLNWAAGLRK